MLIKTGKAKIIGYAPFTIQLKYATGEARQPILIGVDTGAKYTGIAVCTENAVLAAGTIEFRRDIPKLLITRKEYRRGRRYRKTRYRQPRYLNRARRDGWLPPSIQSRVDHTIRWIEKFKNHVPCVALRVEVGKFDIQKLMNPDISGAEYQKGDLYGYWNERLYIFARDGYTCQICHGKSGDKRLRTHHIDQRKAAGSDRAANQATVCETCHAGFHQGLIKHKFKKPTQYKDPPFMNILRRQIFNRLECEITYGNRTLVDRQFLGLKKSHDNDAIAVSGARKISVDDSVRFYIKQFRKKKRSLHEAKPRRGRIRKNTTSKRNMKNTPRQDGFSLNDNVRVFDKVGYISGFTVGGAYVKASDGTYITLEGKQYKQVPIKAMQLICHNNNWQVTNVNAI